MKTLFKLKRILLPVIFSILFFSNTKAQDITLHVMIAGFNNDGVAYIKLYKEGEKFDIDSESFKKIKVKIVNKLCSYKFTELPKGNYGIMVFHDINNNGKLDKNFLGMPKEGVGNSNNQSGIPSFKKSGFTLIRDQKIRILMHYVFN